MVDRLTDDAVAAALESLAWARDGEELVKSLKFRDFAAAMSFVNSVADLAEAADHHPDIAISWNRVRLRLRTGSAGGLTHLDLDLAGAIDGLSGAKTCNPRAPREANIRHED